MSLVSLVFAGASAVFADGVGNTSIGSLQLDALLSEGNRWNSRATRYPVENGAPISDHISRDSEVLVISGVVTSASVRIFGQRGREKLVTAKAALRAIYEAEQPVTIITGMDAYSDFVMEQCDIDRKVDGGGNTLDINCTFVKIRKASLLRATLPPAKVSADPATNVKGKAGESKKPAGKASTSPPEPSVQDKGRSILKGLLG